MCGRYTTPEEDEISRFYDEWKGELAHQSYNIAPQSWQPIVTIESGIKTGYLAKWGLIPHWAKDPKLAYKMINARSETAHEKPAYRTSYKSSRCLVPASGWYEWQPTPDGKQPYYFKTDDSSAFCFAGLHSSWNNPEGEIVETFTILTQEAAQSLSGIHHRMPVVMPEHLHESWLNPDLKDISVVKELVTHSVRGVSAYPVSTYVNSPKNNDQKCIQVTGYD